MTEKRSKYKTRRKPKQQAPPDYEAMLAFQIKVAGLPEPTREFVFHPVRKWRFDFAWPERRVAAEVEGGIFSYGRHVSPAGFIEDCRKYGEALLLGWRVLRFPAPWVDSGEALRYLEVALRGQSDWTPPILAEDGFPY